MAGRELEALAASVPAEVVEATLARGRQMDLWATARALLIEFEGDEAG